MRLFDKYITKKEKKQLADTFPGIPYPAKDLSAFAYSKEGDVFILSLKNERIETFRIENVEQFKDWLIKHHVRDITNESVINS